MNGSTIQKLFFFYTFWCFFIANNAAADSSVRLIENIGEYPLGTHLNILKDSGKQLTFDEIRSPEFEDKWEKAAVIDRLFDFCESLKEASRVEADPSGFLFSRRTSQILGPLTMDAPIPMLIRGTIFSVFMAYNYYVNRLIDNSEKPVMQNLFREEYCQFIDRLRDRAVEIFSGVEEGKRWKQFIK